MYEVQIEETGQDHLRDNPRLFNSIKKTFHTLDEVRAFLSDRYGCPVPLPRRRNKIYVDAPDGTAIEVGFTYSYWNSDLSHMPVVKWYQTDWITVNEVTKTPVVL